MEGPFDLVLKQDRMLLQKLVSVSNVTKDIFIRTLTKYVESFLRNELFRVTHGSTIDWLMQKQPADWIVDFSHLRMQALDFKRLAEIVFSVDSVYEDPTIAVLSDCGLDDEVSPLLSTVMTCSETDAIDLSFNEFTMGVLYGLSSHFEVRFNLYIRHS